MKQIEISITCTYKGKYLDKGEVIEPTKDNIEMIELLNERGFIKPLSRKDLEEIKKFIEEDKNGKFSKKN